MPEKEFLRDPTPIFILIITTLGGVLHYFNNLRREKGVFHPWLFLLDVFNSIFLGVLTFYAAQALGYPEGVSAALAGLTAHLGSKAINVALNALERKTNGK